VSESADAGRERVLGFLSEYHGIPARALGEMSYVHADVGAVRHIFRVASGLDSIVLGEPQILAQIRDALHAARAAGSAGPFLQRLATDALKVGKRARTDTDIARNNLSISHAAVQLAARERADLSSSRVTVLGAGKMASIAARVAAAQGVGSLTVVNRSEARARPLVEQLGATFRPLDELEAAIAESDVVIAAILVDEPAITPGMLEGRTTPLLLVDLGVPRVVDRACGYVAQVEARDVDDLESVAGEQRRRYAREMHKVEEIVDRATDEFVAWSRSRQASGAIAALQRQAAATRDHEVERALRRLGHLSERDQNVVRAMAKALTSTLLHEPVQSLRSATSPDDIRGILSAFGIEPEQRERS
jgi:glutamyl-tRNA reductase